MSKPQITETDLHAWLDGELPQSRRAEVEAYVAAHPADGERLAAYRRNDLAIEQWFDPVLQEPTPARLTRHPAASRSPPILRYAAAVAWLAIGGLAGWQLHDMQSADKRMESPSWARRAAVAHVVYSPEVRHPVEVAGDQEDHLVAWLSKRLGTSLKIPRLDALGYGLVGGRLLPGEQGPAAQFMYQDGQGQRLTLYVRTDGNQNKETAFRFAQEGNVRQFYWIDRNLGYVLSGEIAKDDLLRLANAVYQHLNP
jgi:anti-sigma factor RsiW